MDDNRWMRLAISYARVAAASGEVPVGAVVVIDDHFIAGASNSSVSGTDPCGHAEVLALRAAARVVGNYRMPGAALYVSLEPCLMCFGATVWARVAQVVYAAEDRRHGASRLLSGDFSYGINHLPAVRQSSNGTEAGNLIKDFFTERRG